MTTLKTHLQECQALFDQNGDVEIVVELVGGGDATLERVEYDAEENVVVFTIVPDETSEIPGLPPGGMEFRNRPDARYRDEGPLTKPPADSLPGFGVAEQPGQ